ncbi:site-specific recombinase [Leptolyngbya sp. Heron Island J]|uniref:tyrosine-type recombinase/integrase n=1 Tax=Leptolyngbya sp. Heron Island J TaxID=1385935 RepID=UPI0003B97787|nr:tyrosine-type recombinase/integrase [Leptolyngbya sp. Heron Island J]ESA37944.1 site-specific recombinase [Leptolyngbya sp. Heron Island J]
MVKVQKATLTDASVTWLVLDDNYQLIEPVQDFLDYLRNLERSPNTLRTYAYHLRLYWDYLYQSHLYWTTVGLPELADFILWLRTPLPQSVQAISPKSSPRSEASINNILSAVCTLYDFHEKTGNVPHIPLYKTVLTPGKRYKSFLHHITKGKPVKTRLLKLKVPKRVPKTVEPHQVQTLIAACNRVRDQFLICLLYESGMRIGQALGLRHEDIQSMDNLIHIEPRDDNLNGARAKSQTPYIVHVTQDLMGLYTRYVCDEFMDILGDHLSDYVFVNLWEGRKGYPMSYSTVMALFSRLARKTGIPIHPHMLRHTHATQLIAEGMDMAFVQKRLGHAHIQTTLDTYVHVNTDDLKQAYQTYLDTRHET